MAIPKKGSRVIVVDEQKYRWGVRRQKDDTRWNIHGMHTTLTIGVENYANPKSTLCVTYQGGFRYGFPDPAVHSVTTGEEMKITPQLVADLIRQALAQGWNPDENAATFYLNPAL